MNIFVTGGAGYIGSVLIPNLLNQGHVVSVFDSLRYGGTSLLPCFSNTRFSFLKGDIRNRQALAACLENADLIIHLAAIVGLPACNRDPQLAYSTNYEGTKNLLDLKSPEQSLIFASTVSNYGAIAEGLCDETTPLNPLSHYAKTKAEAEKAVLDAPNTVCLRFATAFGVSPRMRLDLLINDFVFQVFTNRFLIIFERHYKRTFVHVRDIARSIQFAIAHYDTMRQGLFNVGDDANNLSKEEIAAMIKTKMDFHLHYSDDGEDEDQRNYRVSYKKINGLGFKTTTTVPEGIDELLKSCPVLEPKHPYRNT